MVGTWTCVCPKGGIYRGKGHYEKRNGLHIHFPKGVKTVKKSGSGPGGSPGDACNLVRKSNPGKRKYLPHGLTKCEKKHPSVRRKLSRCIKAVEPKERAGKIESAVAVCRASIPCP